MLLEGTKRRNLRGVAINRLMKKSSIKSEPTEEAVHKQDKENVLRMATVVRSEPPAFISPKTLAEFSKDTGMNKLLEWFDNRSKKDENTEGFKYFKEWMSLERDPSKHKTIEEFIDHYNKVVSEAESKGVNNFEVIKEL